MKIVLSTLFFLSVVFSSFAQEYRNWTEADSERQIEAKLIDKSADGSKVRLLIRNGDPVWMPVSRLKEADQKIIKNWVEPVDHLTARVVGSGKGKKTVEVTAKAGSKSMVVKAYWNEEGPQPKGYPKVHKLKKGQEKTFKYTAGNKYVVKAWHGTKRVDKEGWNSKTGLGL